MKVKPTICLLAALALVVTSVPSNSKLLDPGVLDARNPSHSLLAAVAPLIDADGLDVVVGRTGDMPLGERPRLALLDGFSPTKEWSSLHRSQWTYGFEEGLVEAILAVGTEVDRTRQACHNEVIAPDDFACKFVENWLAAPPDRRVFVAFTRSDRQHASAVRRALERQGFVAFTYLQDEDVRGWASSELVGNAFQQAGLRLVIDSSASRGSEGVAFESCAWALSPVIRFHDRWTIRMKEGSGS